MQALSITVVIHVSDLDSAIKYYTDILGFTFDFQFGDYAGLFNNKAAIHLSGPANQGQKKPVGAAHCCIDCVNVNSYYAIISNKGAIITVPIADRAYGVRDFAVDDHDGNTLVFGQAI